MAVRPLSPATDRRLGEPLPHQLSNRTRAHLQADCSFDLRTMRRCGLMRYYHPFPGAIPLLKAGCSRVTHPSATKNTGHLPEGFSPAFSVRLACVRRAASVRPEPGSNSLLNPLYKHVSVHCKLLSPNSSDFFSLFVRFLRITFSPISRLVLSYA